MEIMGIDVSIIIRYALIVLCVLAFIAGFVLAMRNLKQIKIIQEKRVGIKEVFISTIFGIVFGSACIFGAVLFIDIFFHYDTSYYSAVTFVILATFIVIYPLIDLLQLTRPMSNSATEIQGFLETKLFDKFKGFKAIIAAFLVYFLLYIIPVIILTNVFEGHFIAVVFIWFLLFPLFYLAYFGASGVVKNVIEKSYIAQIPKNPAIDFFLTPFERNKRKLMGLLAIIPLILAVNSIISPINKLFLSTSTQSSSGEVPWTSYISLVSSLIFGIQGFFTKYWTKKSKTKAIDFFFGAYVIAGIGINILINFLTTNSKALEGLFHVEIFGFKFLSDLEFLADDPRLILPVLIIQSIIVLIYSIYILRQGDSETVASVKLGVLNKALKLPTEKDLMRIKNMESNVRHEMEKILKIKYRKIDYVTILNSLIQPPVYTKFGTDLNERIRNKAVYTISIIASDKFDKIPEIIEFLFNETINNDKVKYYNPECFDALAEIGIHHPARIMDSFISIMPTSEQILKQYILQSLHTMGKAQKNIDYILENTELVEMMRGKSFHVKRAAIMVIVTIGMYAKNTSLVFDKVAEVLRRGMEANKEGRVLTGSLQEDEYILESTIESLVQFVYKDPKSLDVHSILPFLDFNSYSKDYDVDSYILVYVLKILAVVSFHNAKFIPIDEVLRLTHDYRPHVRYNATDLAGNWCLVMKNNEYMHKIKEMMIFDDDTDVRDMAVDSVADYILTMAENENTEFTHSVLEYVLEYLNGENETYAENASEAIKFILVHDLPEKLFNEIIENVLKIFRVVRNDEVFCDLVDLFAKLAEKGTYDLNPNDIQLIKHKMKNGTAYVKSRLLWTIPIFSEIDTVNVIHEIKALLNDKVSEVRYNALFALSKMGTRSQTVARNVIEILLEKYDSLDKDQNSVEMELIFEAFGVIGEKYPFYKIIISLQNALLGDINPFCKDVTSKALYAIAKGMIVNYRRHNQGEIEERRETYGYPKYQREFNAGDLVLFLIDGIQQKALPESVINIINDSLQDLLPYYLIQEDEELGYQSLNIIQELLIQAYYSNFSNEILETIDWLFTLKMFKLYVQEEDDLLKEQAKELALQYTYDGEQFYDMGEFFTSLKFFARRIDYAFCAYELALELDDSAFYAPKCHEEIGKILNFRGRPDIARIHLEKACRFYEFYDDIKKLKECEEIMSRLRFS